MSTTTHENSIKYGSQSEAGRKKYGPLAISGAIFFLTLGCDLLWASALAYESNMHWFWVLSMLVCFSLFVASLKLDHFKILHYVVDHEGIHLQYQIATGPLETAKVVHRKKAWTDIKSADYSTRRDEDGSETREAVIFSLFRPIESGRTEIELQSERPERIMSMFHQHLEQVQVATKNTRQILAIG